MSNYLNLGNNPDNYAHIGGEAYIYFTRSRFGRMTASKIYKDPDHPELMDDPDFRDDPDQQRYARERLHVMQTKLHDFPENLPERVIGPEKLISLYGNNQISGYTMRHLKGAEKLQLYGDKHLRKQSGISNKTIMDIFRDLHKTVSQLHKRSIVIGDFNDENVLIKGKAAYIVDTDSFQFGNYQCQMFKPDFVDPQLCEKRGEEMMLVRAHNTDSDWYAYTVMLMKCLLFVHPYNGGYEGDVPDTLRPLHRLSIFHKDVKYPKRGAEPLEILPDDLQQYFRKVFSKQDRRGVFPVNLFDARFKTCSTCGIEHARQRCPVCS